MDFSERREVRVTWSVFLAGPVIWFTHFMLVYTVAEAGCTGGGPGLRVFDPPVVAIVTLLTTVLAAGACLASATWAYRRWRPAADGPAGQDGRPPASEAEGGSRLQPMALGGILLSSLSFITIVAVGLNAVFFRGC